MWPHALTPPDAGRFPGWPASHLPWPHHLPGVPDTCVAAFGLGRRCGCPLGKPAHREWQKRMSAVRTEVSSVRLAVARAIDRARPHLPLPCRLDCSWSGRTVTTASTLQRPTRSSTRGWVGVQGWSCSACQGACPILLPGGWLLVPVASHGQHPHHHHLASGPRRVPYRVQRGRLQPHGTHAGDLEGEGRPP